jgi:hypothetical protein
MVINLNKGFGTLVLPGVLAILGWVEIPPGDLICGGGTSGFSSSMISSSLIGSRPLVSPLILIGSSVVSSDQDHFSIDQ